MAEGEGQAAFRQKTAEIVVAAFFLAIGAVVIWDSVRLGAKWGSDGPEAGYFPFYIGLIQSVSALIVLVQALLSKDERGFVERGALKLVLSVLVPSAIYVASVSWLGIYLASAIFIAF